MFDAVIVTDTSSYPSWDRGYGAHRIANHLRLNGFETLVIDFASAMSFDVWQEICSHAISEKTKLLGFSTTWWPYRNLLTGKPMEGLTNLKIKEEETIHNSIINDFANGNSKKWIDVVKGINPKVKVVLGGPKIDFYRDVPADNFVSGLGETQIIDLLTDNRRIWPTVINHDTEANSNTWCWNESKTLYTEYDFIKQGELLTLETSRGCRFKCKFCSYPLIGKKDMMSFMKSKETLYSEMMENYEKWNVTNYMIADDTLNDSTEKLEYLLDVTRRLPFQPKFRAYVRLDVIAVHRQQIGMLKELGLWFAWIGVDSFHPAASKIIGKGMDAGRRKETLVEIRNIFGNSLELFASYIVGLPEEDSQSIKDAADWFASPDSPVDQADFISLRITPPYILPNLNKSEIDRNYKDYGYEITDPQKPLSWSKSDNTDIPDFQTANFLAASINQRFLTRPKFRELDLPEVVKIQDPLTEYFLPLIKKLK